jgi:SSS family solute:Na+ symporter
MAFFSSLAWIIITFLFFTAMVAVVSSLKTKEDNLETAE